MTDNHSGSITNEVEEVAATIAAVLLAGAAHDSVTWVQLYPDEALSISQSADLKLVRFESPFHSPAWRNLSYEELEEMVGGEIRTWHVKDYTVRTMPQRGVQILRPPTKRHRPSPPDADHAQSRLRTAGQSHRTDPPATPKRKHWWRSRRE
jgi:hypothetical protein